MMCDSALVTLGVRGDARNSSSRCLGLSMNYRASVFPMRGHVSYPHFQLHVTLPAACADWSLWKKINEMHPLVLIPSVGVMAIDCAYVLGGLFCCLPQTEHTRSTYLFTLFPLEILEDTEHDGREPNLLVGWAPLSVRLNSKCADSNKYLQSWGLERDGNCLPPLVWPVKSNSTWKALL